MLCTDVRITLSAYIIVVQSPGGYIISVYMSGFFKTVSSLRQNFFAYLPEIAIAGREAFAVLEKAGGAPSRRIGAESPEAWLPAATIVGGPQALSPGGWGGSQRVAFCSVKVPIFSAGQPWSEMPRSLSGRKPARQTPARWVARLCVDRLSVVD